MAAFQLSPQADPNKVFLVNLSKTEGRLDPHCYHKERVATIEALKKSGRKIKKLREVVNFQNLQTKLISEQTEYVGLENIESNTGVFTKYSEKESISSAKVFNEGQILFPRLRPLLNKVYLAEFSGICSTEFYILDCKGDLSNDFLSHYLRSKLVVNQTKHLTSGHTLPRLQTEDVENLPVPILSPEEQIKIIEKFQSAYTSKQTAEAEARRLLSSIDDYILAELGITLPTADNSLKNRVFYANFSEVIGGRFDPKLYDNNTKALFKAVEQGKYRKVSLRSLVTHSVAGSWGFDEALPLPEDEYTQTLCIRATEFDNLFNLNLDGSRVKYRQIGNTKLKSMDIQPNDLLIEKSGGSSDQPVGRISILTDEILEEHTVSFSNFIHKIRIDPSVCLPEYLFCYLKTMHNIKVTEAMQSQTNGIRNLIMREYFNQTVILPDTHKQKEIAETAQAMRQKAQALMQQGKAILEQTKREVEEMILATPSV